MVWQRATYGRLYVTATVTSGFFPIKAFRAFDLRQNNQWHRRFRGSARFAREENRNYSPHLGKRNAIHTDLPAWAAR